MSRGLLSSFRKVYSPSPFFLILYVTSRCNARCKMCYNWQNIENWKSRDELSLEEIERITRSIDSLQQLTISGGEPFLRDDLADIFKLFAQNCDVSWITIPTNGLLPDRIEQIMERACTENPNVHFRIGLSMSETKERMDELYGVKGGFEKNQQSYEVVSRLRKRFPNLNADVNIVFSAFNQHRVKEYIDFVSESRPECNALISVVRGKPRYPEVSDIDLDLLEEVYAYSNSRSPQIQNRPFHALINVARDMVNEINLTTLKEKRYVLPCRCGEKLAVIYDNGDVFPCELLETKIGNLRECNYDLKAMLASPKAKKIVNSIIKTKCFCSWECALYNNLIFSNKYRINMIARALVYMLRGARS